MNELTLAIKQNPGTIEMNFDALEEQLDKKLDEYRGAVFTEDTKTIAKAEIASLRRLKKDIEDGRKTVKKKWMEPYDAFSAKVDEPINAINEQVQAFEEKRRKEKREEIQRMYEDCTSEYEDCREFINLDKLYRGRFIYCEICTCSRSPVQR